MRRIRVTECLLIGTLAGFTIAFAFAGSYTAQAAKAFENASIAAQTAIASDYCASADDNGTPAFETLATIDAADYLIVQSRLFAAFNASSGSDAALDETRVAFCNAIAR